MKHFYLNINGWFDFEWLYNKAVKQAIDNSQTKFIEIGSFYGKSSAYMAVEIFNSKKNIELTCIDTFPIPNQEKLLIDNLSPFSFVNIIKMSGIEYLKTLKDNSISFIMLDGDHCRNNVFNELSVGYDKLISGGIIATHDYLHPNPEIGDVANGIHDFGIEKNIEYHVYKSIAYIVK